MNKQVIIEMIEMLIVATKHERIKWQEVSRNDYFIVINGCKIEIVMNYDFSIDESYYTLSLYNRDEEVFSSYSYNETTDTEEYTCLTNLLDMIHDVRYKITESENAILEGLKELNKDLPTSY